MAPGQSGGWQGNAFLELIAVCLELLALIVEVRRLAMAKTASFAGLLAEFRHSLRTAGRREHECPVDEQHGDEHSHGASP